MEQRRVLVVDDEPTIAESVAARLRAEGFAVTVAMDGPDAIDAVLALPEPKQGCVLVGIADRLGGGDWRTWNASRAAGRAELAGHGPACGE